MVAGSRVSCQAAGDNEPWGGDAGDEDGRGRDLSGLFHPGTISAEDAENLIQEIEDLL